MNDRTNGGPIYIVMGRNTHLLQLALETSQRIGSVALLDGPNVIDERKLPEDQRTARSLFPVLDQTIRCHGRRPEEIKLISVTHGPGSFTGLRLGVTSAKMLAFALRCELAGINTLQVIASQADAKGIPIVVLLDAQRGQLFMQTFTGNSNPPQPTGPLTVVDGNQWLESCLQPSVLIGPGLSNTQQQSMPPHLTLSSQDRWIPRASTLGRLGAARAENSQFDSCWELVPDYGRPSAAEEKAGDASSRGKQPDVGN